MAMMAEEERKRSQPKTPQAAEAWVYIHTHSERHWETGIVSDPLGSWKETADCFWKNIRTHPWAQRIEKWYPDLLLRSIPLPESST